jgi:hypothetical protein
VPAKLPLVISSNALTNLGGTNIIKIENINNF